MKEEEAEKTVGDEDMNESVVTSGEGSSSSGVEPKKRKPRRMAKQQPKSGKVKQ